MPIVRRFQPPWTDKLDQNNDVPTPMVDNITVQQNEISPPPVAAYFTSAPFAWVDGADITVSHGVGRRPDLVRAWFDSPSQGWTMQNDHYTDAGLAFGFSAANAISNNNDEIIHLYRTELNEAGNGKIRLFWFSDVDVPSA